MKKILGFVAYLLVVCGLTFLVIHYVGQQTRVEGSSMEPTLRDGDHLIIDKITYRFREPERFDIIIFPYEEEEEMFFIKRIIGLPGETVRIDEGGTIYINGEKLVESYGMEVIKNPGLAAEEISLGVGEYFVLGDNRNDSMDSRDARVGTVSKVEIVGRAWMRIYPLDAVGSVKHR